MTYRNRENPTDLPCYRGCAACFRCENKGRYTKCWSCSGRHDPELKRAPDDFMDRCRCSEGILQLRLQTGKLVVTKYPHDPYEGAVVQQTPGEDERDWNSYLQETRERLNDPNYDPLETYEHGS